jgi:predicted DNA-binding protein (MmcQ/YjbR family)
MRRDQREAAESLREFALGFPGAFEDFPWGERVVKVGKKVFVFMGKVDDGAAGLLSFGVKLPTSGLDALELPFVEPTGYGLGKSGWVTASFEDRDSLPLDLLRRWIEESYRAVAPKKLIAELDRRTMR